jgi:ADP-ribose pyrophosphatase
VQSTSSLQANTPWEKSVEQTHYSDPDLTVATWKARTPASARERTWTVVSRKPAVVIAPITADGRLVLIRQERIPVQSALWEVPAGQIDITDAAAETAEAVAMRELREETGYELAPGGNLVPLGHFFSSPGFTDECAYLFLARPVREGAAGPVHHESESILDCASFSPREVGEMIAQNKIRDANTLSVCAKLIALGYFSLGE